MKRMASWRRPISLVTSYFYEDAQISSYIQHSIDSAPHSHRVRRLMRSRTSSGQKKMVFKPSLMPSQLLALNKAHIFSRALQSSSPKNGFAISSIPSTGLISVTNGALATVNPSSLVLSFPSSSLSVSFTSSNTKFIN